MCQSAAQMPKDPSVRELFRAQVCVGMCTRYSRLLLLWRIKLVMVSLLHSSATITVNLLEVLYSLIAFKVSSWLLAQKKVALRQEMH